MPASCGSGPRKPPSPTPTTPRRSSTRAGPVTITRRPGAPGPPPARRPSPGARCAMRAGTPKRASSSPRQWMSCEPTPTPTRSAPWSSWRCWRCSPDRPRPTSSPTEALALGQALDVSPDLLVRAARRPRDLLLQPRPPRRGHRLLPRERPARQPGRRQIARGAGAVNLAVDLGSPIRRPARRPPARPPGACAGPAPGTAWPSRSSTWPGAPPARRLGCRRGRVRPGRLRRAGRARDHGVPAWLAGGAARARRRRRDHRGHTRDLLASEDPQDQAAVSDRGRVHRRRPPPAAGRAPSCPRVLSQPRPSGSATISSAGLGRWPRAPRTNWGTPRPLTTCWPCSTPTGRGTWPRCCGPSATWSAPASRPVTATRTRGAFAAAMPACAPTAPLTTSPTACSTTRSNWPAGRPGRGGGGRPGSPRHRRAAALPAASRPRGRLHRRTTRIRA